MSEATKQEQEKPNITLTVDLDYHQGRPIDEGEKSNQWLTNYYIGYAVDAKYKDGMRPRDRRMYARLQDKLDDAIKHNVKTIEIERAELELVKDAFKDCKFPAQLSRFVVVLEDELDEIL